MTYDLTPSQLEAAGFLARNKAALLADEMRVGKTAPAIRGADLVGARNILWLTTASAKTDHARAWRELQQVDRPITLDAFAADGVSILSYDKAQRLQIPDGTAWEVLVCDESHRLKNPKAKRTQFVFGPKCKGDGIQATYKWFLTGTPAPNDPSELWPMLHAAMPEAIKGPNGKPMAQWPFTMRYCKVRDNGFGMKIVGGKNLSELKGLIAPYVLRRKFADVYKDVPPQQFDTVFFDAKDKLDSLYEAETAALMAEFERALERAKDEDARLAILQAIDGRVQMRIRRLTGLAKVPGVVQWTKDRLEDGAGKVVIFAHHTEVLNALEAALVVSGPVARIDGSTACRSREVEMFRQMANVRVFLGQMQAAGEGIDLSVADEVMFVESSWVPKDNAQAAARVVNLAKRRPTYAWFATLAGSIDERIQKTVARKTADIAALFD